MGNGLRAGQNLVRGIRLVGNHGASLWYDFRADNALFWLAEQTSTPSCPAKISVVNRLGRICEFLITLPLG
jgi:hypothetical protein